MPTYLPTKGVDERACYLKRNVFKPLLSNNGREHNRFPVLRFDLFSLHGLVGIDFT
jgi:hypothetical protein